MLYAGLDLSRQRLDVHVLNEDGRTVEVTAVHPDADALRTLVSIVGRHGQEVTATIESMNGARFVHDTLELLGWDVEIADAVKVKGLAPLAAKTDRIDARVLAELARRDLVPAIWLPDPDTRAERERARFRLHLVRHRTALKNRIHATLIAFGHPVPVSDLFGVAGRELLASLAIPEPWATTGLCPFVRQSGGRDDRGPLAKNGPKYLRWALIEAATHAARHPAYKERYERNKRRLGRQRGSKVARVDIARELSTAIWHMLTKREPFAPGRSHVSPLVA